MHAMYLSGVERKKLKDRAAIKIMLAIFLVVIALYAVPLAIMVVSRDFVSMGITLALLSGMVTYFWALADYARSKGYSGVLCMLALLNLIGLIILLLLPEKNGPGAGTAIAGSDPKSNYPRYKRPY
ncbi:MAG: hypothetical protein ACO1SV_19300 [Fimbriimonas sp.]